MSGNETEKNILLVNKAFSRASQVLGISDMSISNISTTYKLKLILIAQGVNRLSGNDNEWVNHFMKSSNLNLSAVPVELLATEQGIDRLLEYVDSLSCK